MGVQEADTSPFVKFSQERALLNERIDEAGGAIDAWFERRPQPVPQDALAQLQALLKTRRALLQELADLDEQFVIWILSFHGRD